MTEFGGLRVIKSVFFQGASIDHEQEHEHDYETRKGEVQRFSSQDAGRGVKEFA